MSKTCLWMSHHRHLRGPRPVNRQRPGHHNLEASLIFCRLPRRKEVMAVYQSCRCVGITLCIIARSAPSLCPSAWTGMCLAAARFITRLMSV
jgi:hypothetical protein